jgi:hypothetical protein
MSPRLFKRLTQQLLLHLDFFQLPEMVLLEEFYLELLFLSHLADKHVQLQMIDVRFRVFRPQFRYRQL